LKIKAEFDPIEADEILRGKLEKPRTPEKLKPVAAIATTGFCSPQNEIKVTTPPLGTRYFFKKKSNALRIASAQRLFPNEGLLLFPRRRYNTALFTTR
jgi:hypothetical protein